MTFLSNLFKQIKQELLNVSNSAHNLQNKPSDGAKHFVSNWDFGQAYFIFIFSVLMLSRHLSPNSVLAGKENFSAFILSEFLLFVFILFAFVAFFAPVKNRNKLDFSGKIISIDTFVFNVLSLFFAYLIFLALNFVSYTWPQTFFWLFRTFWFAGVNLHSQEYILLIFKIIYLFLAVIMLFSLSNYLKKNVITFQYYNLVVLMVWSGLFVMSLSNIFYILLIFDATSLMVVAAVALSASEKFEKNLTYALHYFALSAMTSLLAYAGCLFLHETFNTYDLNAVIFILRECEMAHLVEQKLFVIGSVFVLIKLFFLVGLFPFYQYVLEVSSAVNYGFLFYFLVVSKLPVIVFLIQFIKIIWLNYVVFKLFILVISLSSIIFSTFFIATVTKIKHFLAFSSINQIGFVVSLFAFNDVIGVAVGIFYFLSYCIAVAPLLLLLTFVSNTGHKSFTDGDLDTWPDLARCAHDSYLAVSTKKNLNFGFQIAHVDNENIYLMLGLFASSIGLLTLAGFPPFAGFFLKMSFVEVFIAHNYYVTAFLTVFLSLITTYAYTNVLIYIQPEFRWIDANKNMYTSKVFNVNKIGGVLFGLFMFLVPALTLFVANAAFFEVIISTTNLFFYDNAYHFISTNYLYFYNLINPSDAAIALSIFEFFDRVNMKIHKWEQSKKKRKATWWEITKHEIAYFWFEYYLSQWIIFGILFQSAAFLFWVKYNYPEFEAQIMWELYLEKCILLDGFVVGLQGFILAYISWRGWDNPYGDREIYRLEGREYPYEDTEEEKAAAATAADRAIVKKFMARSASPAVKKPAASKSKKKK